MIMFTTEKNNLPWLGVWAAKIKTFKAIKCVIMYPKSPDLSSKTASDRKAIGYSFLNKKLQYCKFYIYIYIHLLGKFKIIYMTISYDYNDNIKTNLSLIKFMKINDKSWNPIDGGFLGLHASPNNICLFFN